MLILNNRLADRFRHSAKNKLPQSSASKPSTPDNHVCILNWHLILLKIPVGGYDNHDTGLVVFKYPWLPSLPSFQRWQCSLSVLLHRLYAIYNIYVFFLVFYLFFNIFLYFPSWDVSRGKLRATRSPLQLSAGWEWAVVVIATNKSNPTKTEIFRYVIKIDHSCYPMPTRKWYGIWDWLVCKVPEPEPDTVKRSVLGIYI